jgi:hypothetical protein
MGVMVDLYCNSYATPPAVVTLDIDDTVEVVHGHQQPSFFNAHYDERCFLLIHVYDTAVARPVAVLLRPGKTPSGKEVRGHLRRLVRRIRWHWPQTRITIRGDAHYGRPEVMEWCDENGVDFVFGLSGNGVLDRLVDETADDIRTRRALDQQPSHEGNWCQASIALRHGTCCRLIWSPRQLRLFFSHSISITYRCGPCEVVGDALASSKRSGKSTGFCWPPTPPLARQCVLAALHGDECMDKLKRRCGQSEGSSPLGASSRRKWVHR